MCNDHSPRDRIHVPGLSSRSLGEGNPGVDAGADDHHLSTHLRAAGMEDKRDAMHSFRVGGAANHTMDATAMDALMNTWGGSPHPWHADTYRWGYSVRRSGGSEAFSRMASIEADALSPSEPTGQLTPNPPEAKVEVWV